MAALLCVMLQSSAENSRLGLKAEQESGNNIKQPSSCKGAFCSPARAWLCWLPLQSPRYKNGPFSLMANALWGACRGSGTRVTSSKLCVHFHFSPKINFTPQASFLHSRAAELLVVLLWVVLGIACQWYLHAQRKQSRGYVANPGRRRVSQLTNTNQMFMRYFFDFDKIPLKHVSMINWSAICHKAQAEGKINTRFCWKICAHCRTSVKHCSHDNLNVLTSW